MQHHTMARCKVDISSFLRIQTDPSYPFDFLFSIDIDF